MVWYQSTLGINQKANKWEIRGKACWFSGQNGVLTQTKAKVPFAYRFWSVVGNTNTELVGSKQHLVLDWCASLVVLVWTLGQERLFVCTDQRKSTDGDIKHLVAVWQSWGMAHSSTGHPVTMTSHKCAGRHQNTNMNLVGMQTYWWWREPSTAVCTLLWPGGGQFVIVQCDCLHARLRGREWCDVWSMGTVLMQCCNAFENALNCEWERADGVCHERREDIKATNF